MAIVEKDHKGDTGDRGFGVREEDLNWRQYKSLISEHVNAFPIGRF